MHASAHQRRIDAAKYNFPSNGADGSEDLDPSYGTTTRQPGQLYASGPDLPPRIDRASKPPTTGPQVNTPNIPGSAGPIRNPSSLHGNNSLGRSAHERLFGLKSDSSDPLVDYATRSQLLTGASNNANSLERSSIERQKPGGTKMGTSSYDSVSSYDSYNASQMVQNLRLGPNAPDDLKSVPTASARPPLPGSTQDFHNQSTNDSMNSPRNSGHLHDTIGNRNSLHERSGYNGDISSRSKENKNYFSIKNLIFKLF